VKYASLGAGRRCCAVSSEHRVSTRGAKTVNQPRGGKAVLCSVFRAPREYEGGDYSGDG